MGHYGQGELSLTKNKLIKADLRVEMIYPRSHKM